MKRVMRVLILVMAALAACVVVSIPIVKQVVKRRIVVELRQFIREGRLTVEDISVSPKRRQVRLYGVRIEDAAGKRVLEIPKIDVDVRRIHHRHLDVSLRIFEPAMDLDLDRPDPLLRLLRPEAFREESPLKVDRIYMQGGTLTLSAAGILASSEILSLTAQTTLEGDSGPTVDLVAFGPQTEMRLCVRLNTQHDSRRMLSGTFFELSSRNLPPAPGGDTSGILLQVVPADTAAVWPDIPWNVAFAWGPLQGEFRRILPSMDTPGLFGADLIRLTVGPEGIECHENVIEARRDDIRVDSARWVRKTSGLKLDDVRFLASRRWSTFRAAIEGSPISVKADWADAPRLTLTAETISIPLLVREAGETLPLSGKASVHLDAFRTDTRPDEISWKAEITSSDLRIGPEFGKISLGVRASLSGAGRQIEKISGTVLPAPDVPVRISGKGGPRGFSGHAALEERPLKDIELLGESFGREIPLVGETGMAELDVDFFMKPDLELVLKGRVRIRNATALARGFPFRVEGLDVDLPFEYSHGDTGMSVMSEAAKGEAAARSVVIGPYRFNQFVVRTSSKGDRMDMDFSPISAFGGTIRPKLRFQFSGHARQQADLSVEGLSLSEILAPFPEHRDALSGLVRGEAKIHTRGGDLFSAKGTVWVKASDGPGEPMRVSREFLERTGGAVVQKLNLPKQVPYKDGYLKVRLANGRILFEKTSLEAHTMLRKVKIGKVVGSYRIKDLIDVLSNVSSENVKWDIGGKKRK